MSPTRAPLALVALAAYLALACSTDGPTGIAAHLVGSWEASKMEYINPADTVQRVDVVAGGEGLTIEFAASGRYALTYTVPGREPEVEAGDWEVEGATLVMVCDCDLDHPASLATEFGAGTVTLTTSSEFDFNGDGPQEPAQLVIVLARP